MDKKFDKMFKYAYWVNIGDSEKLNNPYCEAGLRSDEIKTPSDIRKTKIKWDSFKIINPIDRTWELWTDYDNPPNIGKSKWKNAYTKALKKFLPKLNNFAAKNAESLWNDNDWPPNEYYGSNDIIPLGKVLTIIPGKLYAQVYLYVKESSDHTGLPF